MKALFQKKCEPCESGAQAMTLEQIKAEHSRLPGWELIDVQSVAKLHRVYKFKNFKQALAFTNKIGALAEQEGHHPSILTEWGKVSVTFWTHSVKGLHMNDFILAAKTDRLDEIR
jgi:4a-hydroxytetrahydrobiopterin dehydratase